MSLLSRSLQSKAATFFPATSYQLINGRLISYTDNPANYLAKGYDINDIIYSIINLITDKIRVAPWGIYQIQDENSYKQLQALQRKKDWTAKDERSAIKLQAKALTPAKNPGKWGDLIKYPNQYSGFSDFIADGHGYRLLLGNKYTWADMIKAGANNGTPNELYLLPAQYIDIFATDTFPNSVVKYGVSIWPGAQYNPTEVLHEKEYNYNWDINGNQLYGTSPLKAALKLIQRNNSSLTASASSFDNEGVKGILHMKTQPGQVDGEELVKEVSNLKQTMMTEWVGAVNRNRIGLSGYDVGWLPIGLNSQEMQVIESEKWDLRRLCSIFGVQSQLLNDPDNKTYNNQEEAEKSLTTRCALSALASARDSINRKAAKDWGLKAGLIIDYDMSVYSELQQDVSKTAEWTGKLLAVSPNEQRELLGLAALDFPEMSEPWVQQTGRVPLSEYQITDVDNVLNNDTEEDI